eukprot:371138-Hanusia_phi.AAC.1
MTVRPAALSRPSAWPLVPGKAHRDRRDSDVAALGRISMMPRALRADSSCACRQPGVERRERGPGGMVAAKGVEGEVKVDEGGQ